MVFILIVMFFLIPKQVICTCGQGLSPCDWESWSSWSSCSSTCAGWRSRRRDMCCGDIITDCFSDCHRPNTSVETEPCETYCPNGGSYRDGICHCPPLRYGVCCERNESEADMSSCSRHCTWNNWLSWGQCNSSCGCGTRVRQRDLCCGRGLNQTTCTEDCNMYDSVDDRACTVSCGKNLSTSSCELCSWNSWDPWTACSRTCGGGRRSRSRSPCCCHNSTTDDCLFDCGLSVSATQEKKLCGEICHNQGTYVNGSCTCEEGFHGYCCETELTDSNCTKCSLFPWTSWDSCSRTRGEGQRSRTRSPCCRTGQDAEDCVRQCALDKDMLTQAENCTVMCCGLSVEAYLYILTGAGSAVRSIIITSLFWCICQHKLHRKPAHIYDRPSYNVTGLRDGESSHVSDYINVAYEENKRNGEEGPYDVLTC